MAYEGTKDVVVVERPIHNAVVVVSLAGCQYAFVVMCEFNQVDPVALAEVCIYLVTTFKVVK